MAVAAGVGWRWRPGGLWVAEVPGRSVDTGGGGTSVGGWCGEDRGDAGAWVALAAGRGVGSGGLGVIMARICASRHNVPAHI